MILRRKLPPFQAHLPAGKRVYAIADVHGEAALLARLLRTVQEDSASRGPADTTLVFLGDFIDRGAEGAELLMMFSNLAASRVVVLKGNHEAALVDTYWGDEEALPFWRQFGGDATLRGLGLADHEIDAEDTSATFSALRSKLDRETVEWLESLPTHWSVGEYYFVHAGVRPGVDLDQQMENDLLWIRQPFLSSDLHHGKVIVHGHTIEPGEPRWVGIELM